MEWNGIEFMNETIMILVWIYFEMARFILDVSHLVTYHTSYCGRDDEPTLVLPTFPTLTDSWESYLVQHYLKSTKTSNSTTRLAYLLLYKTTLLSLAVEPSPIIPGPLYVILQSNLLRMHSLYVILLCFYLFQSPNSVVTKLGLFPLSYFITPLF